MIAFVPQVKTEGIADNAASAIDSQTQVGTTNVYLTEVDIVTGTIDSGGAPIYVSASVDASGSYSGDKATFNIRIDGTSVLAKDITTTRDFTNIGNPWEVKGANIQVVIPAPAAGTRTIKLTAIGTHATYGVTVQNCDLYLEAKKK